VLVNLHLGAVGLGHRDAVIGGALVGFLLYPARGAARYRLDGRGAGVVGAAPVTSWSFGPASATPTPAAASTTGPAATPTPIFIFRFI
jgi:hypothetical protein